MNASVISTFRCNARCHMCNIWKFPTDSYDEIGIDVIEKLPDNLGRINLTGGEPTLREDFIDIVGMLHKKCGLVEISTNGFYTEKLVKAAEKYPDIMIRVSLEGLPALNDKLRGTKDGFDHALRTMLELKKTKIKNIGFSIVFCDRNIIDLVSLYELASVMNVEFAQSTMHNSWYFHKYDNVISDKDRVSMEIHNFIKALLQSKRSSWRLRIKDWLRAYFNYRIYMHARYGVSCQGSCTAGTNLFFLDPFGNISPCNGSDKQWIMGSLKKSSFDDIWNSDKARKIRENVRTCSKDCAFIGTARFDMAKNPLRPIKWVLKNKWDLIKGNDIKLASDISYKMPESIENIPVIERKTDRKLVIK